MRRLVALLLGLVMLGQAHASMVVPNGSTAINWVTGGAEIIDGSGGATFVGRTFGTPSAAARTIPVMEQLQLGLGGRQLAVTATRTIGMGSVAGGIVAATGAGLYIAETISSPINVWLGNTDVVLGPNMRCVIRNDGWHCDKTGTDLQPVTQWKVANVPGDLGVVSDVYAGTSGGALEAAAARRKLYEQYFYRKTCNNSTVYATTTYTAVSGPANNAATYEFRSTDCAGFVFTRQFNWTSSSITTTQCPATFDFFNSAYSKPAGVNQPGPDGKCPSGNYVGMTEQDLADRINAYGPMPTAALVNDLLNKGQPINVPGERVITGPQSLTDPQPKTETTTNPDGSTKTVTTQGTTNYTYNTNVITYNNSTTTTTNNAGAVTTTTKTDSPTAADPDDPCTKNPERVGCTKLGELPTDKPTWADKPVTFQAESLGFGGGCPPPYVMVIRGWSLALNYQPLCDVAPIIRLGMIAITALGCGLWILSTVKA